MLEAVSNRAASVTKTKYSSKVIIAASLGGLFEFYDFFLYGSLAAIISAQFFSGVDETTAFTFALLIFASGFVARPFGGVIFGRLGDLVGRKFTFLMTMLLMGIATFLVGVLPNYAAWGIAAPVILIALRLLQGLAIGGEYGGAAIYVAEHAPPHQRGLHTSWVQTTAGLGLLLSLLVIVALRTIMGEQAFASWGWRLPFLLSVLLLLISLWIRLSLRESPLFLEMKKEGKTTKAPLKDTFSNWSNVKLIIVALLGLVAGTAVIQFTGLFYSMIFLTQILKLESGLSAKLLGVAIIIGIPFSVVFGALSDYVGRKPVIIGSYIAAMILFFPLFGALTNAVNPALVGASTRSPVVVAANSAQCSVQFNPLGGRSLQTSCDVVKATLARLSIPYTNEETGQEGMAYVRIGDQRIDGFDPAGQAAGAIKEQQGQLNASLESALAKAGYPLKADPSAVNYLGAISILTVLVILTAMAFGPLAATLVELFPAKIRYTALSVPFHVGVAWFGGFLPSTAFAIVVATGNIYSGLWYPITVAGCSLIITLLFVPETRRNDIRG